MRLTGFLIVATMAITGCAAGVAYEQPPANPELVYVSPGVQVIADYNEPIFYSDSSYWRNDGGVWYRSRNHSGGWAIATPPPGVARIDRPRGYVHYRPAGWAARGPAPRGPAPRGPASRHRTDRLCAPSLGRAHARLSTRRVRASPSRAAPHGRAQSRYRAARARSTRVSSLTMTPDHWRARRA